MVVKICISGLTGSGKTTISERVASDMGLLHVKNSYKDYLSENKKLTSFIDETDEEFVKNFDMKTIEMASKEDCVVSTWLSPWLIKDATLRIWLYAQDEVRVKRYMRRENIEDENDARARMLEIDRTAIEHFKKFYVVDITNHDDFDLQINTGKISIDGSVSLISSALKEKMRR